MDVASIYKRSLHALTVIHSLINEHKPLTLKINELSLLSALLKGTLKALKGALNKALIASEPKDKYDSEMPFLTSPMSFLVPLLSRICQRKLIKPRINKRL
jgi:hypothetical protein